MSKKKSSKQKNKNTGASKKTIVTQKKTITPTSSKKKITPTTSSKTKASAAIPLKETEFAVGQQNYLWMGIGMVLVFAGMFLMSGGAMPSPDVWEADRIYSFRRTVLAPIVILAGLVIEIYAIFKN